MPTSNKTGLVLKISVVLLVLLALVVYKLNDYFRNEKQFSTETQLRNKVVQVKTTVSSQLSQLKNILSSYETELAESNINWVQLDPFFAIARLDDSGRTLRVSQLLVRSNTAAEHWNPVYLEKALAINKSNHNSPISAQLFRDRAGSKFLIIRFKTASKKELAVVGAADYFQKFFDNERGEVSTALLVTTENILAAHSEGDYIATQTLESKISAKKYLFEKEEIIGTNLVAMNYILKRKITTGFVVPWSIIGVIGGFGCILIAILFYNLDPIERKVERLKKQERAQVYKDTVGNLINKTPDYKAAEKNFLPPQPAPKVEEIPLPTPPIAVQPPVPEIKKTPANDFFSIEQSVKEVLVKNSEVKPEQQDAKTVKIENLFDEDKTVTKIVNDHFIELTDGQINMAEIEKVLAIDDFDNEDLDTQTTAQILKDNLTSQKISVSPTGSAIDKPSFSLNRKDFMVNEFKVNIRRPENS